MKKNDPALMIPEIWGRSLAKYMDEQIFFMEQFKKQREREFKKWYKSLSHTQKAWYHARKFVEKYAHKLWMAIPIRIITTKRYEELQNSDW